MTKTDIELHAGDAAILLHANGDIGLLLPKLDDLSDDDDAPDHVELAMAFGVIARHEVLRHIVKMMANTAAEMDEAEEAPEVAQ